MTFEELPQELQDKAKACKSEEELTELAKAVGTALSDGELEAVAGGVSVGSCKKDRPCPNYIVPPPCPSKTECLTKFDCTELAPCTELIPREEVPEPTPAG